MQSILTSLNTVFGIIIVFRGLSAVFNSFILGKCRDHRRSGPWKTGVAAVDINGDSRLDLYLCYSGALPDPKR